MHTLIKNLCEAHFISPGDDIAFAGHIPKASGDYVQQKCWNFTLGDWKRQEFYSPQFPDVYPNNTECIQLLKGMYDGLCTLSTWEICLLYDV